MTELIRYEVARRALAEAVRFDDVMAIKSMAERAAFYAKQANDTELIERATEIKIRAERRAGEMLHEAGIRGERTTGNPDLQVCRPVTLGQIGVTRKQSSRFQRLAAMPEDRFENAVTAAKETAGQVTATFVLREAKRERKVAVATIGEAASIKTADLGALSSRGMKFGTIYADPPWLYGNQSTRGSTGDHYVGMTVDEICALPVLDVVAENAHLHLWTTNAFLFEAKRVMEAWGFEYRSCFVWVKPQMGMGNYWRVSHEFMLFGIRGRAPFGSHSLMSWGKFDRNKHSAKPEQIRSMIETASPGPYLEMFARRPATGWTVWGNEVAHDHFIDAQVVAA